MPLVFMPLNRGAAESILIGEMKSRVQEQTKI